MTAPEARPSGGLAIALGCCTLPLALMLVIRRMETRERGYTVLMLGGDYYKQIPTSMHEHNEILRLFKQDRRYPGIVNDFSEFGLGDSCAGQRGEKAQLP